VVEREELLERTLPATRERDEVDELPVVLRRQADALGVRDAPEIRGVDRATEMDVQLGELVPEGMRR
jgi:hypothetical protein